MGVSLALGDVDVLISGASHNLHISGGYVSDMGDHAALIPFVRLTAFDPVSSSASVSVADSIRVSAGDQFDVQVDGLVSVDIDTTELTNKYDIHFGPQGSVYVAFEVDGEKWVIDAEAQCLEYDGRLWITKEEESFENNLSSVTKASGEMIGFVGTIEVTISDVPTSGREVVFPLGVLHLDYEPPFDVERA